MATLVLLLLSWFTLKALGLLFKNKSLNENAGALAMSILIIFTGIFHFIYTNGMIMMMPDFVPFKAEFVYVTGILEILAGIGLITSGFRRLTGILLIIFFILILPANIVATVKHVKLSTATLDGPGPEHLYFRIPLQILFIIWTWYFCIKKKSSAI